MEGAGPFAWRAKNLCVWHALRQVSVEYADHLPPSIDSNDQRWHCLLRVTMMVIMVLVVFVVSAAVVVGGDIVDVLVCGGVDVVVSRW